MFTKTKEALKDILSEDSGRLSSMRIGFFLLLIVELFNQTYSTVHNGNYTPMNFDGLASIGSAFLAKSWQKKLEKGDCN